MCFHWWLPTPGLSNQIWLLGVTAGMYYKPGSHHRSWRDRGQNVRAYLLGNSSQWKCLLSLLCSPRDWPLPPEKLPFPLPLLSAMKAVLQRNNQTGCPRQGATFTLGTFGNAIDSFCQTFLELAADKGKNVSVEMFHNASFKWVLPADFQSLWNKIN